MTSTAAAPQPPALTGKGAKPIVIHYFVTNLGYFGLLSTLVLTLNAAGYKAGEIAFLVMVFTLTNKVAKIPLAPWLDRLPANRSVLLGCLIAAGGFLSLYLSHGMIATTLALGLAGIGISVNALSSKQLAAAASDGGGTSRAHVFSLINVGINLASAVAAPVALMFAERGHEGYVLLGIAAAYTIAGFVTFVSYSYPQGVPPDGDATPPRASWRSYFDVLRTPGVRHFLLINFFGWLLYGQLFNALALHVSTTIREPGRLGWLYTANALLVVFLQVGLTRLTQRWSRGRQATTIVGAYGMFAIAFLTAWLVPGYTGVLVFIVLFTLAEMMFVPSVDVLLLGLVGTQSRAIGYSVLSISTALGEATGGAAGVACYRWLADHENAYQFWLIIAGVAVMFMAVTHRLGSANAALRAANHS